jgi:putative restriction endonuclease
VASHSGELAFRFSITRRGSTARRFRPVRRRSRFTPSQSPYDDEILADGFLYAYRAGAIDQPDNRALRAAHEFQVPLVYFIGARPGWYKPVFPCYVREDDAARQMVLVAPGALRGPLDELAPIPLEDPLERRYAVRETRVRLHQARFRGRVVPAYSSQCAICRLKELPP